MKKITPPILEKNYELAGVIDRGSEFEGTLSFAGTFRIDGGFRGYIFTKGVLVVGDEAKVEAEVEAGTVIINGEFTGKVKAIDRIEIHCPAVFRGNIEAPSLMVAEGVVFEGTSQMGSNGFSRTSKKPSLS